MITELDKVLLASYFFSYWQWQTFIDRGIEEVNDSCEHALSNYDEFGRYFHKYCKECKCWRCNSIWFMMRIICPSLPHSVHIRALALFIIFSLKVIIDFTLMSSSSRSNELLSVEGYVGLFLSLKTFESKLFCHSKESVKILLVNISFPIVKEVYHGNQIIIPNRTPFMNTNGWGCLFFFKRLRKNGLDAMRTTLWASICWPSSQARVTSVNSLSRKSFHCKKSFSPDICILELVLTSVLSYPAMTKGGSAFDEDHDNPNNGSRHAWYLIDGLSI